MLRSRFGRRLLVIFVGCSLVPALTIGIASYRSVRGQLTDQAEERLATLSQFAGRTIYDRLTLLENRFRTSGATLRGCGPADRPCVDSLDFGVTDLALIGRSPMVALGGRPDEKDFRTMVDRVELGSKETALVVRADRPLALIHRIDDGSDPAYLVGLIDAPFLWSNLDSEALPDPVHLTLWEPHGGDLLGDETDSLVVPTGSSLRSGRSATGTFRWSSDRENYRAAYWTFPTSHRLALPGLRLVLSEAETDVLVPIADFERTFPLMLAVAMLAALAFGISQIRRRVVPLDALHRGTRHLAEQNFDTRVEISSGDEIEELARSFNVMAARVGQHFDALATAADVDRAVLSLVDRDRIAETALGRLPDLVAVDASLLTLLESSDGAAATIWTREGIGPVNRSPETVILSDRELALIRSNAPRLTVSAEDLALLPFATPLIDPGGGSIEIYPLRFGEEVAGVLAVRRPAGGETGRTDPIQIGHLADQVAVALGNARMVEQVRFLAFYDGLTGLPNRILCKERLAQALARAERQKCHVAVCFLDLDQFSGINDSLGHDLGDQLIERVAKRLLATCREADTVARLGFDPAAVEVARLGGDEFTIVLPDLDDPQDAARVARRVLDSFQQPFRLGTHEVFISASIGIAMYPEDGQEIDDLVKNADVAMYHAKEEGRGAYRMFSAAMNAEAVGRMHLEQRLRRAVEAGEFRLVYQPIVDLESGRVTGAEALIRWNHPDRGVLSPADFISLAEESGLIVRLGEWIFRQACLQAKVWHGEGRGPLKLGINVSARQLQDQDFVATVRKTLAETGVDPTALVLELTETVLMRPDGLVADSIRSLAALGLAFSVDDFGTGYSSLSYLKHFPVGSLKIDRAFIRHLPGDPDYAAITTAIVALAKALGLEVVAEGVETEEQARFVLDLGCHRAQGYLFGPPVAPEEFAKFLDAQAQLLLRPSSHPSASEQLPPRSPGTLSLPATGC